MTTRGIIMLGVGAVAGYLIYDKFIKKSGETTESFTGRNRMRRPSILKSGNSQKPCYQKMYGCETSNCAEVCGSLGGTFQAWNNTCHFPAWSKQCSQRNAIRS